MTRWTTLLLAFISVIVLCKARNIEDITAYVSKTMEFSCDYTDSEEIKNSVFSWEKHPNIVVAELNQGIKIDKHVSDIYKNRSIEFKGNADLKMYGIKVEDEGVYCCRGRIDKFKKLHEKCYYLKVLGDFSVPQITAHPWLDLDSDVELPLDTELAFHCSSADGFPEPKGISWIVSDDNGTTVHKSTNCRPDFSSSCITRKNSQTFNVSSNFTMKLRCRINVTCVVLAHNNVSSKTLQIGLSIYSLSQEDGTYRHDGVKTETQITDDKNDIVLYIAVCVGLALAGFMFGIWLYCRNGKTRTARSSQNHNMETVKDPKPSRCFKDGMKTRPIKEKPKISQSFIKTELGSPLSVTFPCLIFFSLE
ncbi:uncharacterized protein LOC142193530 [Leptodactylus fuscus]|uniref:uncharacterized protein LOC142193530 n=1 Tax=Leptodactylus fuscus TaxID=238119 RepID=UPI003F4F1CE7